MRKRVTYWLLLIIFIIFLGIFYFIRGYQESEIIATLLGVTSFIFGIILAFSIANRHARLSKIREGLREEDAILLEIFILSKRLGKKFSFEMQERIDNLLIAELDYKLIDFDKEASEKLKEMMIFVSKSKIGKKTKEEFCIWEQILEKMGELVKLHKNIVYNINTKMLGYEWISLIILGGLIVYFFTYLNSGTLLMIIIFSIISTSLCLLLLILIELDSLRWQEQNWIWKPLTKLFLELELVPYFPEPVFKQKRIKLKDLGEFKEVRIARYPNDYPNMEGKIVEKVRVS